MTCDHSLSIPAWSCPWTARTSIRTRSFPSSSSSGSSVPGSASSCSSIGGSWTTATPNPDFELNRPEYAGASILLARRNFGSGSSREHAPWALEDYGFRVLLAPSFADIFYNNCFKNGMLPVRLDEAQIDDLFARAAAHPGYRLAVDLETCTVTDDYGLSLTFEVDESRRHILLNGLDDIAMTLQHEDKILAYEQARGIA